MSCQPVGVVDVSQPLLVRMRCCTNTNILRLSLVVPYRARTSAALLTPHAPLTPSPPRRYEVFVCFMNGASEIEND
jgi:hypothetical protein